MNGPTEPSTVYVPPIQYRLGLTDFERTVIVDALHIVNSIFGTAPKQSWAWDESRQNAADAVLAKLESR